MNEAQIESLRKEHLASIKYMQAKLDEVETLQAEVARLTAEILVLKRDLFYCFPTEFEYKD